MLFSLLMCLFFTGAASGVSEEAGSWTWLVVRGFHLKERVRVVFAAPVSGSSLAANPAPAPKVHGRVHPFARPSVHLSAHPFALQLTLLRLARGRAVRANDQRPRGTGRRGLRCSRPSLRHPALYRRVPQLLPPLPSLFTQTTEDHLPSACGTFPQDRVVCRCVVYLVVDVVDSEGTLI